MDKNQVMMLLEDNIKGSVQMRNVLLEAFDSFEIDADNLEDIEPEKKFARQLQFVELITEKAAACGETLDAARCEGIFQSSLQEAILSFSKKREPTKVVRNRRFLNVPRLCG